eukprot:m.37475 g.37475  ORF g.37475 m.37475 type:complete len:428 (+) comp17678_c0_seq1:140-1423(+)
MDVYLSYDSQSGVDTALYKEIAPRFAEKNIGCAAARGSNAKNSAKAALSKCFVVIVSQDFLASQHRMAELALAYTFNIPIVAISTTPFEGLGPVGFKMRVTLGVIEWIIAEDSRHNEAIGRLVDIVERATKRHQQNDDDDEEHDDHTNNDKRSNVKDPSPYTRIYGHAPVINVFTEGNDWWAFSFGQQPLVSWREFSVAVQGLPIDQLAPNPDDVFLSFTRAFALDASTGSVYRTAVARHLSVIGWSENVEKFAAPISATKMLQFILDRFILQWHMQGCLGTRCAMRGALIDVVVEANEPKLTQLLAAALCDQMWHPEPNERVAAIVAACKLFSDGDITQMKDTMLGNLRCRLSDEDLLVRRSAVVANGTFTIPGSGTIILEMWKNDNSSDVRTQCALVLEKHKDKTIRAEFVERQKLENELDVLAN